MQAALAGAAVGLAGGIAASSSSASSGIEPQGTHVWGDSDYKVFEEFRDIYCKELLGGDSSQIPELFHLVQAPGQGIWQTISQKTFGYKTWRVAKKLPKSSFDTFSWEEPVDKAFADADPKFQKFKEFGKTIVGRILAFEEHRTAHQMGQGAWGEDPLAVILGEFRDWLKEFVRAIPTLTDQEYPDAIAEVQQRVLYLERLRDSPKMRVAGFSNIFSSDTNSDRVKIISSLILDLKESFLKPLKSYPSVKTARETFVRIFQLTENTLNQLFNILVLSANTLPEISPHLHFFL